VNITKEQALDFLKRTAQGIAQTFGSSCETLIHDMSRPGHPIIAIYNNNVSGRASGSIADIYGHEEVFQDNNSSIRLDKDIINSLVISKTGRFIKSTTINCVGDNYHYALGINFDYTSLQVTINTLKNITSSGADLNEQITANTNNMQLEDTFSECVKLVGKPISEMKKNDRLQLIATLMQRNVFSFQKSITYVAEQLNVSRYTVYKYCHEIEQNSNI
jgi:predicted transcriptional regulator YheO